MCSVSFEKTLVDQVNSWQIPVEERLVACRTLRACCSPREKAVCEVDLHCHTFFSDGFHSPSGRVFEAYLKQMKAIAITDHDSYEGVEEAVAAGEIFQIKVLRGIECSTDHPGIEILGFFPDGESFRVTALHSSCHRVLGQLKKAKQRQLQSMVAKVPQVLARFGITGEITQQDLDERICNGLSAKGDLSVILWDKYAQEFQEKKIANDVKELHARITANPEALDVALDFTGDLSPEKVIARLREAGAIPVLAHPPELRNKEHLNNSEIFQMLCQLADAGLEGIEVDGFRNGICPESGIYQSFLWKAMAEHWSCFHPERLPLLLTNGGDTHNQPGEQGLVLGCGKNNNLLPEFGRIKIVQEIERRWQELFGARECSWEDVEKINRI